MALRDSFEVDPPAASIVDWNSSMNELDESRQVRYWKGTDRLIYSNVETEANIHVRVVGSASEIKLHEQSSRQAWFILTSPQTSR